ncbi:MAG: hypothetical protein ACE5JC_06445 [Candidatus Zixiibacteriota bacterium]
MAPLFLEIVSSRILAQDLSIVVVTVVLDFEELIDFAIEFKASGTFRFSSPTPKT